MVSFSFLVGHVCGVAFPMGAWWRPRVSRSSSSSSSSSVSVSSPHILSLQRFANFAAIGSMRD